MIGCCLQVFRHLHVLASEARCLEAVDVVSKQNKEVPIKVVWKADRSGKERPPLELKTPCLLPEFATVRLLAKWVCLCCCVGCVFLHFHVLLATAALIYL